MSLLLLAALAVLAVSCAPRGPNRWPGKKPDATFAVVIAPVDVTPIKDLWDDAPNQFAFDLANRVNILGKDAKAWAGETLPNSADPVWTTGKPVPDADWVVVTKVLSAEVGPSPLGPQMVAKVEMHAYAVATGREVFRRTTHGTASMDELVKQMAPDAKPGVKAAWSATSAAGSALIEALRVRQDLAQQMAAIAPPAPEPVVVPVPITVTSIPDHADVLIDGKYRGTTPLALTLPTKPVTIRIERQGYQPWSRELTPESGMQIAPGLEPLTPAAPPAPAPAPVPAPAPAP